MQPGESVHFSSCKQKLPGLASCWHTIRRSPWSRTHAPKSLPFSVACHCLMRAGALPLSLAQRGRGETGLCSLEGRAGGSTSALQCPGAHSLVDGSGAASVGPPQPTALPVWTVVMQLLHITAFLFGPLSRQGQAIGFIAAASCLLDAPMVTNQIFPWSGWPQSLLIIFTDSVIFNHTQCVVC